MDKYDEAIERLLNECDFEAAVYDAWNDPYNENHCLFEYASPSGDSEITEEGDTIGCLTMIRLGIARAWTEELTKEIREDKRIPTNPRHITRNSLPVFAEWQRKLDRTI